MPLDSGSAVPEGWTREEWDKYLAAVLLKPSDEELCEQFAQQLGLEARDA